MSVSTVIAIRCEVPPSTLFEDLPKQRVIASSPVSGINIHPPATEVTATEARKVARVIAAHFGLVPQDTLANVVGVHADPVLRAKAAKLFATIASDIKTEKFGAGSFIQKFVRGKMSTVNFLVQQHNLALDARICQIAVADETQADIDRDYQTRAELLAAMAAGEQLWVDTYTSALNEVKEKLQSARGVERAQFARARDLYLDRIAAPPRCTVDVATLHSRAACQQAKMLMLPRRSKANRLSFWRSKFGKDQVASCLRAAMHVVDVRRMTTNPPPQVAPENGPAPPPDRPYFLYITWNFYMHACELLARLVIGPEEAKRRNYCLNDRTLRVMLTTLGSDQSRECWELIRGLHDRLGFAREPVRCGDWVDVPVLVPGQGRKRAREDSADEEDV